MARRHVGTLPLSGMIALCAILLFAPQARSQGVRKRTFTISGSIGLGGVTLQGLPDSPQTDENGVYSVEVPFGWTGKVTPVKQGYTFQPPTRLYGTKATANLPDQDYTADRVKYTISGSVGLPGVKLIGFPTDVTSDEKGFYTATVDYDFTSEVTPQKAGYRFEPATRSYANVTKNFQDSYKSFEVTFTISGNAERAGIVMKGFPGDPVVTGPDGAYKAEVPYQWSGTVTPTREGCNFTPLSREYVMVDAPQPGQDYDTEVLSYTISGSVGIEGVVMKGLPGDVVSDSSGFYMVSVEHGWGGTVTPEKPGLTFTPPSKKYEKVVEVKEDENYNSAPVYFKIEGTTGVGQVTLSGLPGNVTSDEKGSYSAQVEYGWSGTVVPYKEGYSFSPEQREYPNLTANRADENYKGEKVYFEISGNVGLPGVQLAGFPGSVTSKQDGSYTAKVDYNWSGKVTPAKKGYEFEPAEKEYTGVYQPVTNENYQARTIQYAISGKILDKNRNPVAGVTIVAEGTSPVTSATTDQDGYFEVKVDHNWRGKITPQLEGYTFTPPARPFEPVTGPMANQSIVAEIRTLTITDVITFDGKEPIQDVEVTPEPNDNAVSGKTDIKGRYSVKVPYGWSGSLKYYREDLIFDTFPTFDSPVIEDYDATAPKRPVTTPAQQQTASTQTQQQTAPTQTQQQAASTRTQQQTVPSTQQEAGQAQTPDQVVSGQAVTSQDAVLRRLQQVKSEYEDLKTLPFTTVNSSKMVALLQEQELLNQMLQGGAGLDNQSAGASVAKPPVGRDTSLMPKLHSTLGELARRTNTKIFADLTVKDDPSPVGVDSVAGMSVEQALTQILAATQKPYTFRVLPDNTYEVFYPLSNAYLAGTEISLALQDITSEVGVPIICDPNVALTTTASYENVPLEEALKMMLSATPYSFRRMENYYLVGDNGPDSISFLRLADSRHRRLNHITPARLKELLTKQQARYVQVEPTNPADANDPGHFVTVTAPADIADMIMDLIRRYDIARQHVILDARVVAMERSNLLNLGVQWDFPAFQYGQLLQNSDWSKVFSIGYSLDGTFTNALMAKLNALQANNQLEIVTNPQVIAQDGSQAQLKSVQEEWFMMTDTYSNSMYSNSELEKIESGTTLTITPHIGDSNEITLEMAVEVSDSVAKGTDTELPIVTRRQAKNKVTVQDGGTVAVAGLTESKTRKLNEKVPGLGSLPLIGRLFNNDNDQKINREIAVFVTAKLVPVHGQQMANGSGMPGIAAPEQPAGQDFKNGLAEELASQSQ
mgnify:CR=1 FL=1